MSFGADPEDAATTLLDVVAISVAHFGLITAAVPETDNTQTSSLCRAKTEFR